MNTSTTDLDKFINAYSALYYLNKITRYEDESENGSFILMTNDSTHSGEDSSFLNLTNGKAATEETNYQNCLAALLAVGRWFNGMQENGSWDNTKIIIVADHGIGYGKTSCDGFETTTLNGYSKDHMHPLLMYKDFNSKGRLNINHDFMTTADVPAIALKDVIENPVNPFTKNKIDTTRKNNGVYVTTENLSMPDASRSDKIFTVPQKSWWHIKDDIYKDSNWTQEAPND